MTRVLLSNPAEKELSNLPERAYKRMAQAIDRIADDPVSGSYLLRSTDHGSNLRVMRVGNYRMIYSVSQDTNTVTVITVAKGNHGTNV